MNDDLILDDEHLIMLIKFLEEDYFIELYESENMTITINLLKKMIFHKKNKLIFYFLDKNKNYNFEVMTELITVACISENMFFLEKIFDVNIDPIFDIIEDFYNLSIKHECSESVINFFKLKLYN